MKGVFFQRPLEFKLQINGESWDQGDAVSGTLMIKNHGPRLSLADAQVHLAHGNLKQVRAKASDAFELLGSSPMPTIDLATGAEASLDWSFTTDRNCPITDSSGGLFVLYGRGSITEQMGQLQLAIRPYEVIQDFLSEFTTQFRFVTKALKAGSRSTVDAKLVPPDSRAFASLDYVVVKMSFDGDVMNLRYVFTMKKIEAKKKKKKKKDVVQSMTKESYRTSTGRFDHERAVVLIKEALGEVESKLGF